MASSHEHGRLASLYRQHAASAYRLAYLLTGDPALAEDLTQEAFVRVSGKLAHLRRPDAFEAYLRRTITNLSLSHFRRRGVEQRWLASEASAPPVPSDEPDPVAYLAMRTALGSLPDRQRAALVLRYYEDLSDAQIGAILRCRDGTVRSLISRGVATLRLSIQEPDDV